MPQTILVFGYHDQTAPRHHNLCKEYQKKGYEVLHCHTQTRGLFGKYVDLWKKFRELTTDHCLPTVAPPLACHGELDESIHARDRAEAGKLTTVLVMFPGHYLVPLAWILTHLRAPRFGGQARFPRRKLIFDAFISLYDTLVEDRKKISRWNPYAWFLFFVDWMTCHLADEVLIDTEEHKKYFVKTFGLNPARVRVVYLGTREDLFYPIHPPICSPFETNRTPPCHPEGSDKDRLEGRHGGVRFPQGDILEILFYGTYLPLQGIEYIIDAAKILQDKKFPAHFTLIGSGQTYPAMRDRAEKHQLKNMGFIARVPYEELPKHIRAADLCLGIFGTSAKAKRVIPHKVYDAVGCAVPIITADTPAIREKFTNGKEVILCKEGDAKDLAEKIENFFSKTRYK